MTLFGEIVVAYSFARFQNMLEDVNLKTPMRPKVLAAVEAYFPYVLCFRKNLFKQIQLLLPCLRQLGVQAYSSSDVLRSFR